MTTVHVRRAQVRCAVADAGDRARLDRVARRDVTDRLETAIADALAACGIGEEELVLVRRLDVPVVLDLDRGDAELGAEWAAAIAAALRGAVAAGDAVRYRTVAHALADLVASAAVGDLDRAWAWTALGLWPVTFDGSVTDAAVGITHAVAAEARLGPAVLADLARRPTPAWPALVEMLTDDDWVAVARATVAGAGGQRAIVDAVIRRAAADSRSAPTASTSPTPPGARLMAGPVGPVAAAATALVLAVAADPTVVRGGEDRVLAAVRTRLDPAAAGVASRRRNAARRRPTPADHDDRVLFDDEIGGIGDQAGAEGAPTVFGGLPFLLHLVTDLDVAADADRLPASGLRWLLHRSALVLVDAAPDDPAVLAFAGLAPDAQAPEGPDTSDEVTALAAALSDRLAEMIGDELGDRPVEAVCRRPATIVADPGWLEVRLPLDTVELPIRRAGLDLDPDWLPWLGCVMRFRYD